MILDNHVAIVTGSRQWTNSSVIYKALKYHQEADKISTIVEGEAAGADLMARQVALHLGINVIGVPALWKEYGKSAGVMRNTMMLEMAKPKLIIAFHNDLRESKGTRHMVLISLKLDIPVVLYDTMLPYHVTSHGGDHFTITSIER